MQQQQQQQAQENINNDPNMTNAMQDLDNPQSLTIQSPTNSNSQTPLTLDLIPEDCHYHLFNYLSLNELINVASTNTQLKISASAYFAQKYSKKR